MKSTASKSITGSSAGTGPSVPSKSHQNKDDDVEGSEEESGSVPPPSNQEDSKEEPEYDPSDQDDEDLPQFPITHEITLKDHTKVVSALALDPSGARIISGSHDYDCKLWDFGGMDMRCKPFKSWEPAGTYHVRPVFDLSFEMLISLFFVRYTMLIFLMTVPSFCVSRERLRRRFLIETVKNSMSFLFEFGT